MKQANHEPKSGPGIAEATRELERFRRLFHQDSQFAPDLVDCLCELAKLRSRQGESSRAGRLFREALAHCAESPAHITPELSFRVHSLMAYHFDHGGEFEEALLHYERAVKEAEKGEGLKPVQIAVVHNNAGMLCKRLQRPDDAEKHYLRAIDYFSRDDSSEDDPRLGSVYNNLGVLYYSRHQFEKSRDLHTRALEFWTRIFGEDSHHYDLGQSYNNLAAVYKAMGDYQTAGAYFAKVDALADGVASLNEAADGKTDGESAGLHLDEAI